MKLFQQIKKGIPVCALEKKVDIIKGAFMCRKKVDVSGTFNKISSVV